MVKPCETASPSLPATSRIEELLFSPAAETVLLAEARQFAQQPLALSQELTQTAGCPMAYLNDVLFKSTFC